MALVFAPANNKNCLKAWNGYLQRVRARERARARAHSPADRLTAVATHSRVASQEEKLRSTLDQLHIMTELLAVHCRWKPQQPGLEPGTRGLEVKEAKTTSADVFTDIRASVLHLKGSVCGAQRRISVRETKL